MMKKAEKMRKIFKIGRCILRRIAIPVNALMVRMRIIKPYIYIYMDGGLCSQMNMWAQGQYYKEQGFDVYYDLGWYRRSGKGIEDRKSVV